MPVILCADNLVSGHVDTIVVFSVKFRSSELLLARLGLNSQGIRLRK